MKASPQALIKVYRVADQNALTVASQVREYVDHASRSLPVGVKLRVFNDSSTILKSRILLLVRNMAIGLGLVIVLLGVFSERQAGILGDPGNPYILCRSLYIFALFLTCPST